MGKIDGYIQFESSIKEKDSQLLLDAVSIFETTFFEDTEFDDKYESNNVCIRFTADVPVYIESKYSEPYYSISAECWYPGECIKEPKSDFDFKKFAKEVIGDIKYTDKTAKSFSIVVENIINEDEEIKCNIKIAA